MTDHSNVYDGLLGSDDSHWAFGTDFEDPLAGVDTTVPDGVDHALLAQYCLMLGDDALVFSHRLSEWCSNAPDLEDDIALANIALDLLGQARLLLARAAAADPSMVPAMPEGSPVPPEDALAFFRDAPEFRHVRLAHDSNGDFAQTMARLVIFSTWRLALLQRLVASRDAVLAAVAAKGVKEVAYHRDYSARWFVTLAGGTPESRQRQIAGLAAVWPLVDELFFPSEVEAGLPEVAVDRAEVRAEFDSVLVQILTAAGMDEPAAAPAGDVASFEHLLAGMQEVARAHPMGRW